MVLLATGTATPNLDGLVDENGNLLNPDYELPDAKGFYPNQKQFFGRRAVAAWALRMCAGVPCSRNCVHDCNRAGALPFPP